MILHENRNLRESQIAAIFLLILSVNYTSAVPHIPRFTSHVSFVTPAASYSHGVGDIEPRHSRILYNSYGSKPLKKQRQGSFRSFQGFKQDNTFQGYQSERPLIPFPTFPSFTSGNSISIQHHGSTFNSYGNADSYKIPALPPSPYKVDSPDAESLWPEGLLASPGIPNHQPAHQHNKYPQYDIYTDNFDPYLLQGIEAVQAFERVIAHGELFHHEIPHERALLANQQHRLTNGLHANRLGSIRRTSPWYRI